MTLYERISLYCRQHKKQLPTPKERSELGGVVASYIPRKEKITSLENGYWIPVNDYSEESYPTIDFLIQKHYEN